MRVLLVMVLIVGGAGPLAGDHASAQWIPGRTAIGKKLVNNRLYGPFGPLDHSLLARLLVLSPFSDPAIPVFNALARFAANLKYGQIWIDLQ